MLSRRQVIAGAAAFSMTIPAMNSAAQSATPMASPASTPVISTAPTTEDILPAWLDAQDALRQLGESATQAFWDSDTESLIEASDPMMTEFLQAGFAPDDVSGIYTRNHIQFAFREAGAWFFGQYSPESIEGVFSQGGPAAWSVTPEETQADDFPTGKWTGTIGPGTVNLAIELDFSGTADDLSVNLSIPTQMLSEHPMTDVVFAAEIPVGDVVDTRIVPSGGDVGFNYYAEQYEWGNNTLMLLTVWDGNGQLAGLNLVPQGYLNDVETPEPIVARLPFEGAWVVFWGGETEFRNYHATTPSQRYAADLMVWQNGSTAEAPGTENEQYHAFGQPYLAPVDGTVVTVLADQDDIPPQSPGSPGSHPAGNHIVIEVDAGFVVLAHCQHGSILVQEGDSVAAGDVVAAVGNSGNTSEAHVHIHAQTHLDMYDPQVAGIPIVFENALENGEPTDQLSLLQGTIVEHRS